VRAPFGADRHKMITTLRADGSPRVSGIETVLEDGELAFRSTPDVRKGADVRRPCGARCTPPRSTPVEGAEAHWGRERSVIAAGRVIESAEGGRSMSSSLRSCASPLEESPRFSSSSGGRPGTAAED